jgi:Ca-activated chloride channel family protein
MKSVADIGGGKHYHAATGAELVAIFEEIANNLPTIFTQ